MVIKCRTCRKELGHSRKDFKDGVTQIGQGKRKSLLTFCDKKCLEKYENYEERKCLWRLRGSN